MKQQPPPRPEVRKGNCDVCGADIYKIPKSDGRSIWMAACGSEHLEVQVYEQRADDAGAART